MSTACVAQSEASGELTRHWPAILACFLVAVFGWGFGFSGTSVYLAELQRLHGWSSATIASAVTVYYILGGFLLTRVHAAQERFGPGRLLTAGVVLLGTGATLFCLARQPWQLFPASAVMAAGWAGCTSTAISTTLAAYFDRKRGLAITLALNGASVAGFTIGPILVVLAGSIGIGLAVPLTAAAALVVVLPMIAFGLSRPTGRLAPRSEAGPESGALLRTWRFWSIALPFALALAAQVGLIVHLVSLLLPSLGAAGSAMGLAATSIAAVTGRLGLATVVDRLPQRLASAISVASQACGLALMLGSHGAAWPLYAGCVLFGLSVGNVITYPALIVQREFPPYAFGAVVGLSAAVGQFAFAPAPAFLGLIHDLSGSYTPVLILCMALQICAAVLVLRAPRSGRA